MLTYCINLPVVATATTTTQPQTIATNTPTATTTTTPPPTVTGTTTPVNKQAVVIGNRRVVVKNSDGTTKIVHQTITAPTPKTPQTSTATSQTNSPSTPTPTAATPHKVQIIRGADGKVSVRGLAPGQQLIQMPDGKLHVLTTTPGKYYFCCLLNYSHKIRSSLLTRSIKHTQVHPPQKQ